MPCEGNILEVPEHEERGYYPRVAAWPAEALYKKIAKREQEGGDVCEGSRREACCFDRGHVCSLAPSQVRGAVCRSMRPCGHQREYPKPMF